MFVCCTSNQYIFMGEMSPSETVLLTHGLEFVEVSKIDNNTNAYVVVKQILAKKHIDIVWDSGKYFKIRSMDEKDLINLLSLIDQKLRNSNKSSREDYMGDFLEEMDYELSDIMVERKISRNTLEFKDSSKHIDTDINVSCITYSSFNDIYTEWCDQNQVPLLFRINDKTLYKSLPPNWCRGKESSTGTRVYFKYEDVEQHNLMKNNTDDMNIIQQSLSDFHEKLRSQGIDPEELKRANLERRSKTSNM